MIKKSGMNRNSVVGINPGRTGFSVFGRLAVPGLIIFFTSIVAQASLFELTLNSRDLHKVNAYDFYTWSVEVPWEVSQSVLAGDVYYNAICTFDESPNTIGMHLLDVEENNSYTYNLGFVLTATFNSNEKFKTPLASGGGSVMQSEPLNTLKKSDLSGPGSSLASSGRNPDEPTKHAVVPEPVTLVTLALAVPLIYGRRRRTVPV